MEVTPPVARYQQVAAHLRTAILNGEYEPGQSLPSEADLANTYSLSRPTIRQAIAALQAEGLVTVEHGRGMFVRTRPARRATATGESTATTAATTSTPRQSTGWQ